MRKMIAVLKREYVQAVRKKMFIIMTLLFPLLMSGVMVLPTMMISRGLGLKRIAVLDATGKLRDAYTKPAPEPEPVAKKTAAKRAADDIPAKLNIEYVDRTGDKNLEESAKPYNARLASDDKSRQLDGVLLVPSDAITNSDARLKYYSRSATDFIAEARLSTMTNQAVHRYRLQGRGLNPDEVDRLMSEMHIDAVQLSKTGEQKKGGAENFVIGFVLTALLILPSFIYGLEIMRGIIQEKTDRIVEVLVSSMSPAQLLVGKILGIAAVGLTQISVWLLMGAGVGAYVTTVAAVAGQNVTQFLRASTFIYFGVFFILAYLTYVCVYAIGGAICNSEKEAQQLIAPITLIMMLPWILLAGLITNPDSGLAVGFSLAPVFGPMTMFIRTLVADPPMTQVLTTIAVSLATIAVFFWVTAKIFRVGILSYGKRPTIPELWRWIKVA
jgi:ABC-2 type transport system permease protein